MKDCPTPKKVKYKSKENAIKGGTMAFIVFDWKGCDAYKCRCGWWHLTTQRFHMTDKQKLTLERAKLIRKLFGTNRSKLKKK